MPSDAVVRLSDHVFNRAYLWPECGDVRDRASLVSIAEVLDAKRLASMAAHPSNHRAEDSAEPVEDPMLDEELW